MMHITETDEYDRLAELFIKNGLEFSDDEPVVPTDIVKCWKAENGGRIIGGCVLAKREGEYIIDGIAVEPEYRKNNTGSLLLEHVFDYLKKQGACRLFIVARAPEFFRKHGFEEVKRENAPVFFECFTCSQYNTTCFPEVMEKKIKS